MNDSTVSYLNRTAPVASSAPAPPVVPSAIDSASQDEYDALLADLQANATAYDKARELLTPNSAAWRLGVEFQSSKLAYQAALTTPSATPADLTAAWSRMETAQRALMGWGIDAIPPAYRQVFIDILGLEDLALGDLSPVQVAGLRSQDLTAWGDRVKFLKEATLRSLSPAQLSGVQLHALSSAQLSALNADQMSQVSARQVAQLSAEQVVALGTDVAGLPHAAMAGFTVGQVNGMSTAQVIALDGKVASFTKAVVHDSLLMGKLTWVTPAGIAQLCERHPELLFNKNPVLNRLGYLTAEQGKGLTASFLSSLGDDVSHVPPQALQNISKDQISGVRLAALNDFKLGLLHADQIAGVTVSQLTALSANQLQKLAPALFSVLSPALVRALPLGSLTTEQLMMLTPSQLSSVNANQINSITEPGKLTALGTDIASLPEAEFARLNAAAVGMMSAEQVRALDTRIASLSDDAVQRLLSDKLTSLTHAAMVTLIQYRSTVLSRASAPSSSTTWRDLLATALSDSARAPSLSAADLTALGPSVGAWPDTALRNLRSDQVGGLQLNSLSAQQLGALTGTQLTGVTAAQLRVLSDSQKLQALGARVSALTPEAMTGLRIDLLTHEQLRSLEASQLTASQIGLLSRDQVSQLRIAALSDEALMALRVDQVAGMPPATVTALGSRVGKLQNATLSHLVSVPAGSMSTAFHAQRPEVARVQALTKEGIAAIAQSAPELMRNLLGHLVTPQGQGLTAGYLRSLGHGVASLPDPVLSDLLRSEMGGVDLGALSVRQLSVLSAAQLGGVTRDQLRGLSVAQLQALRVAGLTADTMTEVPLKDLTLQQIGTLQGAQLTQVTANQVSRLSGQQVAALGVGLASLSGEAIRAIQYSSAIPGANPPTGISMGQINSLRDAKKLSQFHADVAALLWDVYPALRDFPLAELHPELAAWPGRVPDVRVQQLSATEIAAMTPAHIWGLRTRPQLLSDAALASLSAEQLSLLPLAPLSVDQLGKLRGAQLAGVNRAQVDSLSAEQRRALLPNGASLPKDAIARVTASDLSALSFNQIRALDPKVLAGLSNAALGVLFQNPRAITLSTIRDLSVAEVAAAPLHLFSIAQLAALSPTQLSAVSPDQIKLLRGSQQRALGLSVAGLSPAAMQAVDLSALTQTQLAALSGSQLEKVSPNQVRNLGSAQIASLGSSLAGLSATTLAALSPKQMRMVAVDAIRTLTDLQLKALSQQQVAEFTSAQVRALSPAQKQTLGNKLNG